MRPSQFRPLRLPELRFGSLPGRSTASKKLNEQDAFGENPGALRMFCYVPPSLKPSAPLVVILHGCGQTAADYDAGTGWTCLADQLGFAVLAPEQDRSNNMNGCFNWFQAADTTRGQGEAASIHAMIEWMVGHHPLARAQIFITGLSAGGAMSAAMLAAYPDIFAGGAILAGLPAGAAANVPEALNAMRRAPEKTARQWGDKVRNASSHKSALRRISIWHGDADATVHVSNAAACAAQWSDVLGLDTANTMTEDFGPNRRTAWRAPDGTVAMEEYRIAHMGHGVPVGGKNSERYGETGPYFLDVGVSSTARIAAFWGFAMNRASGKAEAETREKPLPTPPRSIRGVIADALRSAGLLKA